MTTTVSVHPDMQVMLEAREEADRQLGPSGDDPVHARRWWNLYASVLAQPPPADMKVHDRAVPTAARDVPVRVYEPAGLTGTPPCIVYMHGGGFTLGDLDSSDSVAWGFADQCSAVVVSVDY